MDNGEEVVIEKHPGKKKPLVDYHLAWDSYRKQMSKSRRFGYESDLTVASLSMIG